MVSRLRCLNDKCGTPITKTQNTYPCCPQALGYEELKHHSRQNCVKQLRNTYVPPPWDPTACYANEIMCHSHYSNTGMGSNITITYNWKHFIYEDYDRALYNR